MSYRGMVKPKPIPQSAPLPGREAAMAKNLAGGYGFKGEPLALLRRWLYLGTPNNLYYQSGEENVRKHMAVAAEAMKSANAGTVAEMIVDASERGVSIHTPILAVALFSMQTTPEYNAAFRPLVLKAIRTGSHLLEFCGYVKELRGFGPKVRGAITAWIDRQTPHGLAYQALKYQNRYGWRMRDALRVAKPRGRDRPLIDPVLRWVVGKHAEGALPEPLGIYESMLKEPMREADLVAAIRLHGLTHEMVPGNQKMTPGVWRALFEKMPVGATIRNLGNLTDKGMFGQDDGGLDDVTALKERLTIDRMKGAYIHPLNLAMAAKTYEAGGEAGKSRLRWQPNPKVTALLMGRVEDLMSKVEPTGKRVLHALDVSGSMFGGSPLGGLHPAHVAGIMALSALKSDPDRARVMYFHTSTIHAGMSEDHTVRDVLNPQSSLWRGVAPMGTDASLPFAYAVQKDMKLDAVVVYTDAQTWAGIEHVSVAFERLRKQCPGVRAIFVYVVAYGDRVTLTDPDNPDMHDIVASADLPKVLDLILRGE